MNNLEDQLERQYLALSGNWNWSTVYAFLRKLPELFAETRRLRILATELQACLDNRQQMAAAIRERDVLREAAHPPYESPAEEER
jgi:hypothetical protein